MNFVGIMARNLGTKEREVLLTAPEEQPQQRRIIISDIALPGFRFHPTEEELVDYYLRRMVQGKRNSVDLIASLDLYQYDPWELPAMALMGEREWFFYCPRDKKYPNGARPNRVTTSGYWKATGTDRAVRSTADSRCIGLKKTLVFYTGRAPRGSKTDWIMNEYRIPNPVDGSNPLLSGCTSMSNAVCSITITQSGYQSFITTNDVALCRIYRKSSSVSSIGLHLESKAREGMVRSSSNHQHLVSSGENTLQTSEQKVISSYNQQLVLDSPAQIVLQGSITSAPAAATVSSSSSFDHQVRPEIANSLLSSHAVMARLLEETGCYDGCSSQPIMSLESSIRSTHGGTTNLQQNDTNMGVSNIEGSVPSSSKSNINSNSTKADGSLERDGPFTDLFQHLQRMQHLDAGLHGNTSRNAVAVQPATDVNEQRILGVCHIPTPPYHTSAGGVTEDLLKLGVHRVVQSCSQTQRMHHNNNSNIEVHSRLLLPNIAEYWGLGDQCSPSNSTSNETSTSARLELDAFHSLGFPT